MYNKAKDAESKCPEGYTCTENSYYTFGDPESSDITKYTDYNELISTTNKYTFIFMHKKQKQACIKNKSTGKLDCYKNNDYENAVQSLKSSCTDSYRSFDTYEYCYFGYGATSIYKNGDVNVAASYPASSCTLKSDNSVTCS